MGAEARIDSQVAEEARKKIDPLISAWLTKLLDYPGFREWKNKSLLRQIFFSISPDSDVKPFHDFEFDKDTLAQHNIVSLYMNLQDITITMSRVSKYFEQYPPKKNGVNRADHLKMMCEIYFSKTYQFFDSFKKLIKSIIRRAKIKDEFSVSLNEEFVKNFSWELEQRNKIHHGSAYSDFEIDALGVNDLLSSVQNGHPKMSAHNYRKLSERWVKRVALTKDKFDFWLGVSAAIMLSYCKFLQIHRN